MFYNSFVKTDICYGLLIYGTAAKSNLRIRRERLKSELYLRLKKRKTFFLKKTRSFRKFFSFGKCRTVPKNVKGGPFLIYKHAFCCKKLKGGTLWDFKNFRKKVAQCRKKSKGGTL